MFDNIPSTVTPLDTISQRRRSKSLDDLITKHQQPQYQKDRLSCYQDTCTPTSPIVTLKFSNPIPKRRHSLCVESKNTECIRLASIYGWVYTPTTISRKDYMHDESVNQRLKTSRSFSHIPHNTGSKFTRMFGRKTLNNSALFPNKTIASITTTTTNVDNTKENGSPVWLDRLDINDEPEQLQPQQCEQYANVSNREDNESKPPPKPIENDPHVFDLLSKDSSLFIHYGKCDTTVTSATVEKLIEKLTREMDNDFLMDFFLTFRQFTTPIKLCKLLILRFRWALLEENDTRRLVRIRTFVVIRHWLTHYWKYDFTASKTLRFMLCTFLTQLQTHPVILASPRDERIVKNLRNVLKRQRKYYNQHKDDDGQQNKKSNITGIQTSRKDSAITLSSCRNSLQPDQTVLDNKWTSKVKRTLKRSVSQSTASVARTTNIICSCKSNNSSLSSSSNSVLNGSSSSGSVNTYCMIHSEATTASTPPTSRLFLSHRLSPGSNSTNTSNYKSFILKFRSEVIAQQFCIIERDMLQKVTWDELVELRWRKRSSKRQSYVIDLSDLKNDEDENLGIDHLIGFFNMTCQWVASEVVRSNQMETRIKVIEKLIRIALKCHHHRNYSTLMQILLGLQSPAVSRLSKTWQKVDHCQIELFNQLKEMAKPFRNWKNVRDCMTKATEEVAESFAVESVLTNSLKEVDHTNGCIPFLGLYLSDLVFIDELPTFIEPSCIDTTYEEEDEINESDSELFERLSSHFVNYNKFRITASVVKHVLAFQVLSRAYNFKIQTALYSQLQSLSLLDNSQIRKASFLCEE